MIRFFQLAFPHDVSYWCTGTDHCKKYLSNEARRWALVSSSLAWEKTGKRKQRRQVIKFQTIFDEQNHNGHFDKFDLEMKLFKPPYNASFGSLQDDPCSAKSDAACTTTAANLARRGLTHTDLAACKTLESSRTAARTGR